jgi:hypothetical protein
MPTNGIGTAPTVTTSCCARGVLTGESTWTETMMVVRQGIDRLGVLTRVGLAPEFFLPDLHGPQTTERADAVLSATAPDPRVLATTVRAQRCGAELPPDPHVAGTTHQVVPDLARQPGPPPSGYLAPGHVGHTSSDQHGPVAGCTSGRPAATTDSTADLPPPAELVTELIALGQQLQALVAEAVDRFGQTTAWQDDGARSPVTWLTASCHLPRREAARLQSLGEVARMLPAFGSAWRRGEVTSDHLAALAPLRRRPVADALGNDQHLLAELASTLSYPDFRRALAYWLQHADPDGCEAAELERRARRRVTLHQSFEGTWFGDLCLDPISGAIVATELERLEEALFASDLAEAASRHDEPTPTDHAAGATTTTPTPSPGTSHDHPPLASHRPPLRRTAVQRRADALVEMAIRSRSGTGSDELMGAATTSAATTSAATTSDGAVFTTIAPMHSAGGRTNPGPSPTARDTPTTTTGGADPGQHPGQDDDRLAVARPTSPMGPAPPGPLFTVLVDWPTLAGRICELANGRPLAPGAVVPWLTRADLERAVWRGRDRIDVAATTRLFTGATRRAIELRDRVCGHPYCFLPAERCQVDHVVAYTDGGLTTQSNGQLLCAFHNRQKELVRRRQLGTWHWSDETIDGSLHERPDGIRSHCSEHAEQCSHLLAEAIEPAGHPSMTPSTGPPGR